MGFIFSKKHNSSRVAISLFFFAHGLVLSSWASRIPSIKTQLNLTDAELGTLLLLLPIGQISTMPLAAKLIRSYGSKRNVHYGFLLYPLVLIFLGFSTRYLELALGLFFFGVLGNLCNIAINTQGVELEAKQNTPLMSSFHGAWIGFAVINKAKEYLTTTSLSIKEISDKMEFADASLFCRYFKRYIGQTPNAYRNQ